MPWIILDHRDDRQLGTAESEHEAIAMAARALGKQRLGTGLVYAVDVYEVNGDGRYHYLALITTQEGESHGRA